MDYCYVNMMMLLVLMLCVLDIQAVGLQRDDCIVSDSFDSPYVATFHDRPMSLAGCDSAEIHRDGQKHTQVHVIHLIEGSSHTDSNSGHSDRRLTPIVLHLRVADSPRSAREALTTRQRQDSVVVYNEPLVFVLHSPEPVLWKLDPLGISNTTKVTFVLDQYSRIDKGSKLNTKVRKKEMPSGRTALMSYVRQKYHVLTSYAELASPHSYTKYVTQVDSSLPTQCIVSEYYVSPLSVAHVSVSQDIRGCSATWNKNVNNKDVHILELDSAGLYSNLPTEATPVVSVTLGVNERQNRNTHTVLVLKAHQRVKWHLRTERLRGSLDVIADYEVDKAEVLMNRVQVTAERLTSMSGHELRVWVRAHYGPAVSFTEAASANRFIITLDAVDPALLHEAVPPSSEAAIAYVQRAIASSINLICQPTAMEVSVQKAVLQTYGFETMDVSLLDSNCVATMNDTHYSIDRSFTECNTQKTVTSDSLRYQNSLVLHHAGLDHLQDVYQQMVIDSSEAPPTYHSSQSRFSPDDVMISLTQIDVPVHCDFSVPRGPIALPSMNNDLTYSLDVFSNEEFTEPLSFPSEMPANSIMYVQTTVTGDDHLKAMFQKCTVVASPQSTQGHNVINTGCKIDNTVIWYEDQNPSLHGQRFSFTIYDHSEVKTPMYLQCFINVCSDGDEYQTNDIRSCLPQEQMCIYNNVDSPTFGSMPTTYRQSIVVGPFTVTEYEPVEKEESFGTDTHAQHPSGNPDCKPYVRVEGLDSGTVVGIAFAAFIIGVLLTAVLWFIHTHTGPLHKLKRPPHSSEHSGESTPSSTAPIRLNIHHT